MYSLSQEILENEGRKTKCFSCQVQDDPAQDTGKAGSFHLLWPPAQGSGTPAMGQLVPWAGLWESSVCATAAPDIGFVYHYEQGTRARREGSDFSYCVIFLMNQGECSLGRVEIHG